ncbi:DNA-formamidopyrimidine glycosylase family protein [Paenibacillus yanchengensis]|uniref:DNA-(apurinic or apyrimidinic site) lyase n=1 Tax=Paenibacillus yanchengensis TaxID=2035833 RepID=A0ABW4YQT8_9BACL
MYELPEIEYWKMILAGQLSGKTIEHISTPDKVMHKQLTGIIKQIQGVLVWHIERRGLYLSFHLDNGQRFVIELNNDTAISIISTKELRDKKPKSLNVHFSDQVLQLQNISVEQIQLISVREAEQQFKPLGLDPLDRSFTLERMQQIFAQKRSSIKTAYLDQTLIAGIGDKYSDEIAFAARLSPAYKMNELTSEQWESLYEATRNVLKQAVDHYIALDCPVYEPTSNLDQYKEHLQVFEREGIACPNCKQPIVKKVIARKKTYLCHTCQPTN